MTALKKLEVYHGKIVNGFKFFFNSGDGINYGLTSYIKTNNETNEMISIDLENKEIVSIIINHGYWVNTLRFEIYDRVTKTTTWSQIMPDNSYNQTYSSLDASQFVVNKKSFKINLLIGEVDKSDKLFGHFLQSLQFEYSVCLNDLVTSTVSTITTTESTKTTAATTTALTTPTSLIVELTIPEKITEAPESPFIDKITSNSSSDLVATTNRITSEPTKNKATPSSLR